MPNIKSAIKRVQIAEARRQKNAAAKSTIKTAIKKFDAAIEAGDKDKAKVELVDTVKVLDKAATKGLIHKNAVARKKSSLQKAFNQA